MGRGHIVVASRTAYYYYSSHISSGPNKNVKHKLSFLPFPFPFPLPSHFPSLPLAPSLPLPFPFVLEVGPLKSS